MSKISNFKKIKKDKVISVRVDKKLFNYLEEQNINISKYVRSILHKKAGKYDKTNDSN